MHAPLAAPALVSPAPKPYGPRRFRFWFDALIDYELANPTAPLPQIAAHFGRGAPWISTVRNSDLYKARRAQRRDEFTVTFNGAILDRTAKVAVKSLDLILEKMDKQGVALPLPIISEIADSALARLGYGGPTIAPPGSAAPVSVVVNVTAAELAHARGNLRAAEQARVVNGTPHQIEATAAPIETAEPKADV